MVDMVWTLVSAGMEEDAVLNLPLDKLFLYNKAERRRHKVKRMEYAYDTAGAVSGVFSKDGLKKYLKSLDEE